MIDFDKSALLVIDLQNDFVRQGAPMEVEDARTTLPKVRQIIDLLAKKASQSFTQNFYLDPVKPCYGTGVHKLKSLVLAGVV